MAWWAWTLIAVYIVGFVFFFWVNLMSGPVTPALALMRAVFWPIWITTGWPNGTRY